MQEWRNSIELAMELGLTSSNPSKLSLRFPHMTRQHWCHGMSKNRSDLITNDWTTTEYTAMNKSHFMCIPHYGYSNNFFKKTCSTHVGRSETHSFLCYWRVRLFTLMTLYGFCYWLASCGAWLSLGRTSEWIRALWQMPVRHTNHYSFAIPLACFFFFFFFFGLW